MSCLVVVACMGAARFVDADCDGCGEVRGSVAVEQAAVRSDGPKHDLDVVAYLAPVGVEPPPPAVNARAEIDQRGLVFIPHVLAVQRGTTVTFLNNDNDQHNVYFLDDRTGATLDIGTWGQGVSVDHIFSEAGTMITLCKLHLEMAAYVVVVDGPWFVQVELDPSRHRADFVIDKVPPGEYTLNLWHKKLKQKGGPSPISVGRGETVDTEVVVTKAKYARGEG